MQDVWEEEESGLARHSGWDSHGLRRAIAQESEATSWRGLRQALALTRSELSVRHASRLPIDSGPEARAALTGRDGLPDADGQPLSPALRVDVHWLHET